MSDYTIDAKGKKLGRVASMAASYLIGKDSTAYNPRNVRQVKVKIVNTSKLAVSEKKLAQKIYVTYTGYPGGLKKESLGSRLRKEALVEPVKEAVFGMLPRTKLRSKIMKNLIIEA